MAGITDHGGDDKSEGKPVAGVERCEEQKSCYMREVQNYLHKFWKEAFTYIKDDCYPILNNLAKQAMHPFTTKWKNFLHFGSDEGAEIAAVYHSIISTVKLQGKSA